LDPPTPSATSRPPPPPPPLPHFICVLPVTNSTEQRSFRKVANVYSWPVICPLLWSKNVHDGVKSLLLDSILTPLSPAHSPISSLFSPQSGGQNCLCHLPPKFLTLHAFHMIWVRGSLIFKTRNQNSDIYNDNTFVFLCMRITFFGHYSDDCCL